MEVQILLAVEGVVHRALRDARRVDHPVESGVVEPMSGELVEGRAKDRLLLGLGKLGEPGRTMGSGWPAQAVANAGSSTASWKLLPMARSATFGSPINLITVFRTRSWSLFFGANAGPRPTAASCLERRKSPSRSW